MSFQAAMILDKSLGYGTAKGFDWRTFAEGMYDSISEMKIEETDMMEYNWMKMSTAFTKLSTALTMYYDEMSYGALLQTGG